MGRVRPPDSPRDPAPAPENADAPNGGGGIVSERGGGAGGLRELAAALRLTSSAFLFNIVFGIGTTKATALFASTEGVALIGLYRQLASMVTLVLPLGMAGVAVQRLSRAATPERARQILRSALLFVGLQAAAAALLAGVAAAPIARSLFGAAASPDHLAEVRLVLLVSAGILGQQAMTALLNGRGLLRESMWVGLATSAATLATVYPFLRIGPLGLPLVLGGTSFLGLGLGAWFLWRAHPTLLVPTGRRRSLREALADVPLSTSLTVDAIVFTGAALAVQSILNRHYGLEPLGYWSAASTLENTAMLLLMSSLRSYALPTLGRLPDEAGKRRFLNHVLVLLLFLLLLGGAVLIVGARPLLALLYSSRFEPAARLLPMLVIAMVGQVYLSVYGMLLLHHGEFAAYTAVNCAWAALRLLGVWWCVANARPLVDVAWAHAAGLTIMAFIGAAMVRWRSGGWLVRGANAFLGALAVAAFAGATALLGTAHPVLAATVMAAAIAIAAPLVKLTLNDLRRARPPADRPTAAT